MILKPKSLEEMQSTLRALPKEKRKVIVLVGRHPNEGTTNIAVHHHKEWEKHGAVAVRIPAEWTPHGFWHRVERENLSKEQAQRLFESTPTDFEIIKTLSQSRFEVPVVNFHGTAIMDKQDAHHLVKGTKLEYQIAPDSKLVHPLFQKTYSPHGQNEVVVEFFFKGARGDKKRADALLKRMIITNMYQLGQNYLGHGGITREALDSFSRDHSASFETVLKHLARTGLGTTIKQKLLRIAARKK